MGKLKEERHEGKREGEPSDSTADQYSLSIQEYFEDENNPSLFVICEGKKCELSIQPNTGYIRFAHEKDLLLVKLHPDVLLTTESKKLLEEHIRQSKLAECENVRQREIRPYLFSYLSRLGTKPKREPEIKPEESRFSHIPDYPEFRRFRADLFDALEHEDYHPQIVDINSIFRFFCGKRLAGQTFVRFFNFLKGLRFTIDANISEIPTGPFGNIPFKLQLPNMVFYPKTENMKAFVNELIEEISRIANCEELVKKFLAKRKSYQMPILVVYGFEGRTFRDIDSAYIVLHTVRK